MKERKWTLRVVPVSERMFDDLTEWEIHDENEGDAIMGNVPYYPFVPDDLDTAHLIAAAPDLYEALDNMLSVVSSDILVDVGIHHVINAALAKARGETQ